MSRGQRPRALGAIREAGKPRPAGQAILGREGGDSSARFPLRVEGWCTEFAGGGRV